MSYIKIEKDKLVNLEYALSKELIRSNRGGSYASTTINGCNTRKYHGLLIVPHLHNTDEKVLLLSSVDETIIQNQKAFNLAIHQYHDDTFYPHGHRYLTEFETDPIPATIYRVGSVIFKKEVLLSKQEEQILIRYTVLDAHSKTTLRLQPLTAFRNIHELSHENFSVNNRKEEVSNGIKIKMYEGYPELFMQCSVKTKFITAPDWNKNIIYREEKKRGYEYTEDLFTYGYFETNVKKGDKIIFSAATKEVKPQSLNSLFNAELKKKIPRNSFENSIRNSNEQFFYHRKNELLITAGFPWYHHQHREALLSLSTLCLPNTTIFHKVFDTILNRFFEDKEARISPDIPLLIIRALQEYTNSEGLCKKTWEKYRTKIFKLLKKLFEGKYNAFIHDNGLLYIPEHIPNRTWMDQYSKGKPVTPRNGFVVEVNALWYNALMYLSAVAELSNSRTLKKIIGDLPKKVQLAFNEVFVNKSTNSLYDFVNSQEQNTAIRPNQLLAISSDYSPVSDWVKKNILTELETHLLTPTGLRTLSPMHPSYIGKYAGNHEERNAARHQGTVHPWLIAEYCKAKYNLEKEQSIERIKKIYYGFENEMNTHGIGSISELYDGDPPHKPNGASSYAPSIAALLRLKTLIDSVDKK